MRRRLAPSSSPWSTVAATVLYPQVPDAPTTTEVRA